MLKWAFCDQRRYRIFSVCLENEKINTRRKLGNFGVGWERTNSLGVRHGFDDLHVTSAPSLTCPRFRSRSLVQTPHRDMPNCKPPFVRFCCVCGRRYCCVHGLTSNLNLPVSFFDPNFVGFVVFDGIRSDLNRSGSSDFSRCQKKKVFELPHGIMPTPRSSQCTVESCVLLCCCWC